MDNNTRNAELDQALDTLHLDAAVAIEWQTACRWFNEQPLNQGSYRQIMHRWAERCRSTYKHHEVPELRMILGREKLTLLRDTFLDESPVVSLADFA